MENQVRTVIVTGGASGIGLAIVLRFATAGAHVHVIDNNKEMAGRNLSNIGTAVTFHECDVSKTAEVKSVIDQIASAASIDCLINNAGIAHVGNVENTTESDMDRIYAVNIKGVYNCIHAAIPHMKRTGGGVIINMASVVASVGIPDRFAYSTSKGAIVAMTYATAKDYLEHNIRCNCVSPARVHTPFVDGFIKKNYPGREKEVLEQLSKTQPVGRMAEPAEIAGLVYYLCSDEATFITGSDIPIDGGFIRLNN